ncbi:MAG: hypothetical protein CMP60_01890 [Flavobacteriales bacterium]|nr:hypothetical protein [Flavobacteriales bacterium]
MCNDPFHYHIPAGTFFFPSHPFFDDEQLPNKKSDINVNNINLFIFYCFINCFVIIFLLIFKLTK